MLCQFTVKNYSCIKDEITLDMQATNISEHIESLIADNDGEKFLPLAVLYGPNGSGKSTVLNALYSLICKIMRPICAVGCNNQECIKRSDSATITPFSFSKDTINKPSEFELFFRTSINEYQYSISILKDKILHEELYKKSINGIKYTLVFKRQGLSNIELKGSIKEYNCSNISENLPLISYLGITHRRNKIIKDIINWFDNCFTFIDFGNPYDDARISVASTGKIKELVLDMMREMDIDIEDYRIKKQDKKIVEVYTTHIIDDEKYELKLANESSGTVKIFGILPLIADCLLTGSVLMIDELDAKLHPMLLKYVINLFRDSKINSKGAQLIFTSHDLSTMNKETFRRDEIWFVAKGENQSSKLYSLVEFKGADGRIERNDLRYDKRYLEGRYGADPYLQKIIDWGEY